MESSEGEVRFDPPGKTGRANGSSFAKRSRQPKA
jgi:hypothetical protein